MRAVATETVYTGNGVCRRVGKIEEEKGGKGDYWAMSALEMEFEKIFIVLTIAIIQNDELRIVRIAANGPLVAGNASDYCYPAYNRKSRKDP